MTPSSSDPSKYAVENAAEAFEKLMAPKEAPTKTPPKVDDIAKKENLSRNDEALLRALAECIEQGRMRVRTVKTLIPKGKATMKLNGLEIDEVTTLEAVEDEPEPPKTEEKQAKPEERVPILDDV